MSGLLGLPENDAPDLVDLRTGRACCSVEIEGSGEPSFCGAPAPGASWLRALDAIDAAAGQRSCLSIERTLISAGQEASRPPPLRQLSPVWTSNFRLYFNLGSLGGPR